MRTVIFVLGLYFLTLLEKHWNIMGPGEEVVKVYACILFGCILLDIFKDNK